MYDFQSSYDDLDPTLTFNESSCYKECIGNLNKLNTAIFQSCDHISTSIAKLIASTKDWDNYFTDIVKLKEDKESAFKLYAYYSSKITKLRKSSILSENANEESSDRLERNEIKYVKAHSEYLAKSYRAYNHLEKLGKNIYNIVDPAVLSIYSIQKNFFNMIQATFQQSPNLVELMEKGNKKVCTIINNFY